MKKKITAIVLCVAMLAIAVVSSTLAYFTDTDEAKNAFTVGNVDITLEEPAWKPDEKHTIMPGTEFEKDPTITVAEDSQDSYIFLDVQLNRYKSLVPTMALDAVAQEIITQDDVEACMVDGKFSTKTFLANMINKPEAFRAILDRWFVGIKHNDWKVCGFFYDTKTDSLNEQGNWMTVRLAYVGADPVAAGTKIKFMEKFNMPKTVTTEMIEHGLTANFFNAEGEFNINFKAYAIQAAELNLATAFDALFAEEIENNAYWDAVDAPEAPVDPAE